MKVLDVMRRDVVMVHPETPVGDLADLMMDHDVTGLPVVDEETRLIGWVPEGNLLIRTLAECGSRPDIGHLDAVRFLRQQRRVYGKTAADLMVTKVASVQDQADLMDAVRVMLERKVSRLPVVRGDRVVGYLTRAEILRATRNREAEWATHRLDDDELLKMVKTALRHCIHIDPSNLSLQVEKGLLRASGTVGSREEREHLTMLLSEVPGVRGVVNNVFVEKLLV
ncbi:MAG: CBS domain-containing protein [Candidatus Xenobia bacterium]